MNDGPDQRTLLDEVLAEGTPTDFRAALLGETLRLARRRRHGRRARLAAGGVGVMLLAAWLAWPPRPEKSSAGRPPVKARAAENFRLVETRPLPAGDRVATTAAGVHLISSEATIGEIATTSNGFRYINDAQLLTLIGPAPAVLIRTGPESEELVFATAADSTAGHRATGP